MLPKITDERTAPLRSDSKPHCAFDRLQLAELKGEFLDRFDCRPRTVTGILRPA